MCGRGACTLRPSDYLKALREKIAAGKKNLRGDEAAEGRGTEKYNIPPGSSFPIVKCEGNDLLLQEARWGITGSSQGYIVNARGETVHEKPTFKYLERCILFLSGYFEWEKSNPKNKQPYYFTSNDSDVLPLAALYNKNQNSYTVLTTAVHPDMSFIHERMPVVLNEEGITKWLDTSVTLSDCKDLVISKQLNYYPVTKNVGKTAYNSRDCTVKIQLPLQGSSSSDKSSIPTLTNMWGKKKSTQRSPQKDKIKRPREEEIIIDDNVSVETISDDDSVEISMEPHPRKESTTSPQRDVPKVETQREAPEVGNQNNNNSLLANRLRSEYLSSLRSSLSEDTQNPGTQPAIKRLK